MKQCLKEWTPRRRCPECSSKCFLERPPGSPNVVLPLRDAHRGKPSGTSESHGGGGEPGGQECKDTFYECEEARGSLEANGTTPPVDVGHGSAPDGVGLPAYPQWTKGRANDLHRRLRPGARRARTDPSLKGLENLFQGPRVTRRGSANPKSALTDRITFVAGRTARRRGGPASSAEADGEGPGKDRTTPRSPPTRPRMPRT